MIKDSKDKIKIQAKEVEHCYDIPKGGITGIFGATEEKCVTTEVPGIELERVITGAVEFDMVIGKADLRNKIKFYVPYQGMPQKIEDLYKLTSTVGEGFVYPKFS